MKRIAFIIADSHAPDARVQKEIISLQNHGYIIDVYCWDRENNPNLPQNEEKSHGNIDRYKIISKRGSPLLFIINNIRFYFHVLKKVGRIQYEFVHLHSIQVLFLGLVIKLLHKTPLIYDVHEITETFGNNIFKGFGRILWEIEKQLIKYVDMIITATEQLSNRYKYYHNKQQPITLLNCLYYKNIDAKSYTPGSKFILGRIGNLRKKSRIDMLAEIVKKLDLSGNKVGLVLSGINISGYEKESEGVINSMGALVEYHKWTPITEFAEMYKRFHVTINIHERGDILEEQFACFSKVYESISFGVPVIINDFPTMTRFVEENKVGIVVKDYTEEGFAKEIEKIIKNPEKLAEMSKNCIQTAKHVVNWEIMEKKLIKGYENLSSRINSRITKA